MKKEIREIENGVMRITTVDERWYSRPVNDKVTGLPTYEFLPSVTWICESYPKGVAFYKYLANKFSWDEAEALKKAAGERPCYRRFSIAERCRRCFRTASFKSKNSETI